MKVVVDTSVLFAATLRDARVRRVLLTLGVEWITPSHAREELLEHLPEIAVGLRLAHAQAEETVGWILRAVAEVAITPDDPEFAVAHALIASRDPSDVPFLAAALKHEALGIWSLDKDFDAIPAVPRLTTASVARLLELVGPDPGPED